MMIKIDAGLHLQYMIDILNMETFSATSVTAPSASKVRADMPWILPKTIEALIASLNAGADIAVPMYQGKRGNPVALSTRHLANLLQLTGDTGTGQLMKEHSVREIVVDKGHL